jgi:hypothetical protein
MLQSGRGGTVQFPLTQVNPAPKMLQLVPAKIPEQLPVPPPTPPAPPVAAAPPPLWPPGPPSLALEPVLPAASALASPASAAEPAAPSETPAPAVAPAAPPVPAEAARCGLLQLAPPSTTAPLTSAMRIVARALDRPPASIEAMVGLSGTYR